MFILSSDIFSHLLLSSIYLTSTSFPFSLSGHPSSSLFPRFVFFCCFRFFSNWMFKCYKGYVCIGIFLVVYPEDFEGANVNKKNLTYC